MKSIAIIVSILICLVLLWHLLTLKFISPYQLNLYICAKRGGKSCTVAKNCLNGVKHKRTIYCNCDDISIPDVRIFDTMDLGKYDVHDAQIEIDEISLFYDSRNHKETSKEFIKWLRSIGHKRLIVNAYTQDFSVEKRIRQLADNIYIGKKYMRVLTIWRKLRKEIAIKESALDAESQIVDSLNFVPWYMPGSIRFTWIPRYIGYFDSFKDLYSTMGDLPYSINRTDEDQ